MLEQQSEPLQQAHSALAYLSPPSIFEQLAASLAHEIKQPIAAAAICASVCTQALRSDTPDLSKAREAAAGMVRAVNTAIAIVDRVRSLYTQHAPWREWVSINEIIRDSIVLLRSDTRRGLITISADLAECVPPVMADRVLIQQVLLNLMLNGIEAMENIPGELIIESRLTEAQEVLISVRDSGIGIPKEYGDRIFDAFFTTKAQGTGMGLAISRAIVEAHGGRLWTVPNCGPGAVFCLSLPVSVEGQI